MSGWKEMKSSVLGCLMALNSSSYAINFALFQSLKAENSDLRNCTFSADYNCYADDAGKLVKQKEGDFIVAVLYL